MRSYRNALLLSFLLLLALETSCGPASPLATATPTRTPPTLMVGKLVDASSARPGDELTYTIVIMNDDLSGQDPGTDVTLMDPLPQALSLVSDSLSAGASYDEATRTILWRGQVYPGGNVGIVFRATLGSAASGSSQLVNTTTVTDAFGREKKASASTRIVAPTPTLSVVRPTYARIEVQPAGVAFEVPSSWKQLSPDWLWSMDGSGESLAFAWQDLLPPMEVEAALLPKDAVMVGSESVELEWGSGRRYTLQVPGSPASGGSRGTPQIVPTEMHFIITLSGQGVRRAFDFYAVAPSLDSLTGMQPALQHMVESAEITLDTIELTQVTVFEGDEVIVRGMSTLDTGDCIVTQLSASGLPELWWPEKTCALVESDGSWELVVLLDVGDAPETLDPRVDYEVRAWQRDDPLVTAVPFPFDLAPPPASGMPFVTALPDSAHVPYWEGADLDGDGQNEYVVLAGFGQVPEQIGYDWLQLLVVAEDSEGEYVVLFQSDPLAGNLPQALQIEDINLDGWPEALSIVNTGSGGEMLYVLQCPESACALLEPQGGLFEGQSGYGETGASWEDRDGDGQAEILAHHGPAASLTDVYCWDGKAYSYVETFSVQ